MTDSAWITSGAERSAPPSHSGASTPDVHRVANAGANLVAAYGAQLATLILDGNPPHTRLELQRRDLPRGRPRAQRCTSHLRTMLACSAVEGDAKTLRALGRASDRRHAATEARTKNGRATTQSVACLTSARRHRDTLHEAVELSSVRRTPTIGRGHGSRIAVERGALFLKGGVE